MKGTRRERQIAQIGRDFGYLVSSRRHEEGPGDQLWAPKLRLPLASEWPHPARCPLLIEVKGTVEAPWSAGGGCFGPDERAAMIEAGVQYGVAPLLAWWPPGLSAPVWLPVEDWPA